MSPFRYFAPRDLVEACELLGGEDAVPLAGGTDLLVALRHREVRPGRVVDLKQVTEIGDQISIEERHVSIGARVVMSRLVASEIVRDDFPALASAASVVGSVQIRNRATLAGNLCNASPAADTATPLLAYSARVIISDGAEERGVPLEEFFTGPGSTVLRRGEVVTSVELPLPEGRSGSAFARVTRRRGVDLASVNLACFVDDSGRARFGLGAVGPTPLAAESTVDQLTTDDGMQRLLDVASPISDVRAGADYRRAMLRIHARRALQAAIEGLG